MPRTRDKDKDKVADARPLHEPAWQIESNEEGWFARKGDDYTGKFAHAKSLPELNEKIADLDRTTIADVAIDAGYITLGEAARVTGKRHQSVRERALRRGVNAKERRAARIVKTLAEIGKLLHSKGD